MKYKHIKTGQEIELNKNNKLYDMISKSPSWKSEGKESEGKESDNK